MPETSHPRVGVGVLLADNHGQVLLTLRKLPPEAGCWSIVGGKVDFLETLEETYADAGGKYRPGRTRTSLSARSFTGSRRSFHSSSSFFAR